MHFQPEIMIDFSIDTHTKGQNSATSTTCNFERNMVTTPFFACPEQAGSELSKNKFWRQSDRNDFFIFLFPCKMAIPTQTSLRGAGPLTKAGSMHFLCFVGTNRELHVPIIFVLSSFCWRVGETKGGCLWWGKSLQSKINSSRSHVLHAGGR